MDNKICKNCKYRKQYEGNIYYCTKINEDYLQYPHNNNKYAEIMLEVLDDTGTGLRFRVNDNFSCILFENKEGG